jgi:hypothetical protein
MPSDSGSPEPVLPELAPKEAEMQAMADAMNFGFPQPDAPVTAGLYASSLTTEEQERLADGEPYCFRCGKPASSFSEYPDEWIDSETSFTSRADYVRQEEGTYNPVTNRFACDACYIAIGMPSAYDGWVAP